MLEEGTGFGILQVSSFRGRPAVIPHLVQGNGNDFIRVKDGNAPLEVFQGVFDAFVDFFPGPHEAILEILEEVDLSGPLWSIFIPSTPVPVIIEVILPGAGHEDLMSGFGPGKFIAKFAHLFVFHNVFFPHLASPAFSVFSLFLVCA
jgi:hypothetical protein